MSQKIFYKILQDLFIFKVSYLSIAQLVIFVIKKIDTVDFTEENVFLKQFMEISQNV